MRTRPIARVAMLLPLALGLLVVPIERVAACSCAWSELPQAIAEAELAIVGRLVGSAPGLGDAMPRQVSMTWAVERARGPLDGDRVTITAWEDDGANCGVSFDADARWLVLAYSGERGMETSGCMRNVRLTDVSPDELAVIDEMVATPVAATTGAAGPELPVPLLVGGGAMLLLAAASALAFRRPTGAAR